LRVPLESLDGMNVPHIRLCPRVLNDTIGGLFLPQQISLFHGKTRAPLTILAHAAIVSAARIEGTSCVYLDSGTNYSPPLVRSLSASRAESAELLKRVIVGQVLSLDDISEKVIKLQEMGNISLVVLDSLTGAMNLTDAPGSRGRQRKLFGTLDAVRRTINRLNTHFMITDYSSHDWLSGEPTPLGGNVLSHAVDSVVLVDKLQPGKGLTCILIERCTQPAIPPGVIIRTDSKGIRTIR
jgi:RecA/RadA recombinase